MFGHPTFPLRASSEFLSVSDSLTSPDVMSPLDFPLTQLSMGESLSLDSVSEALYSGSSGSSGGYNSNSPSSLGSCSTQTQKQSFMQRSVSSHSLQKNGLYFHFASSLNEFMDSDSGSVRRVFSTGDLDQGIIYMGQHSQSHSRRSESPLSSESNAIIEGMSRACRYSPEEKKERIERYRSKRNLRNFNKKIKYACRKTLADSRPRIRGRFARNEETEKSPQVEWGQMGEEDQDEDEENWINFLDSLSANLINP